MLHTLKRTLASWKTKMAYIFPRVAQTSPPPPPPIKTVHWCMFKRGDFRAVIFHEASACVAATVVLWFALSKGVSPVIVVIHHLATGTCCGDHKAFYSFFWMIISTRMFNLNNLRETHCIALMFDAAHWRRIRLTIDTEQSKMLGAAYEHVSAMSLMNITRHAVCFPSPPPPRMSHECMFTLKGAPPRWNPHLKHSWQNISFSTLCTWEYEVEEDASEHWNGNEAGIFYAEALHLVAVCQGLPLLWRGWGVWSVFPRLRWVCLGWGKKRWLMLVWDWAPAASQWDGRTGMGLFQQGSD